MKALLNRNFALPALLTLAALNAHAAEKLPVVELRIGSHKIVAEVAATEPG